jgi:hypothetical protein
MIVLSDAGIWDQKLKSAFRYNSIPVLAKETYIESHEQT